MRCTKPKLRQKIFSLHHPNSNFHALMRHVGGPELEFSLFHNHTIDTRTLDSLPTAEISLENKHNIDVDVFLLNVSLESLL